MPFERGPRFLARFATRDELLQFVELDARVLVEIEEGGDGRRGHRLRADGREIVAIEVQRAEERLVQELREVLLHGLLAEAVEERFGLNMEELERPPQERELHRAPPLLDEVEVRG